MFQVWFQAICIQPRRNMRGRGGFTPARASTSLSRAAVTGSGDRSFLACGRRPPAAPVVERGGAPCAPTDPEKHMAWPSGSPRRGAHPHPQPSVWRVPAGQGQL